MYEGAWWVLARPDAILSAHLAVVAVLVAWAIERRRAGFAAVCAGLVAGWLAWTFCEYALHRWLLHHRRVRWLRRVFWVGFHREHHGYPGMRDPDHHGVHVAITMPIGLTLAAIVLATTTSGFAVAAAAGWIVGYCGYEALHWLFHGVARRNPLLRVRVLRGLWLAHGVHHLHSPETNYGFSTLFWDRRFGTVSPLHVGALGCGTSESDDGSRAAF